MSRGLPAKKTKDEALRASSLVMFVISAGYSLLTGVTRCSASSWYLPVAAWYLPILFFVFALAERENEER
jgi:hypothetical protein